MNADGNTIGQGHKKHVGRVKDGDAKTVLHHIRVGGMHRANQKGGAAGGGEGVRGGHHKAKWE